MTLDDLFSPILAGATLNGRLVACLGAGIGIALTVLACSLLPLSLYDLPVIVAPIGASAVLVFAVPSSPLAQPWPVIGGNTVSALVGVAVSRFVPDPALAAAVAVGGAILVMSLLRCLHPPGGAAALTVVIGGPAIHAAGYGFALAPVGINSIALVLLAIAFHRITRRSYPHKPASVPQPTPRARFDAADIDAALAEMHDSFDISREDLTALLDHAERHARTRNEGR
ncbi:CBS domain-containing membrane protein [Sphingomonas jinjuensis]|uniref:CBS domain-containing membrane protein n=1 Tax=Sphingomonas jinjuensis TaxID=535907 RepID=A0A840F6G4_9SPHN|nr:HPP family protein [Sphingomonas jinjuensis]MBB4154863.1 CBS domain-containing membrane protein [Sphingomonas jinjuensis]